MADSSPDTPYQAKRVLLTGASGFLGKALLSELRAQNIDVVCYLRRPAAPSLLDSGATAVVGELSDDTALKSAVNGCDTIIHCAGMVDFDPAHIDEVRAVHVDALERLVSIGASGGVRRLLYVSSHWTIGYSYCRTKLCTEDDICSPSGEPGNIYQQTKLEGERLLEERGNSGMECLTVNPAQIWGAENRNELFHAFLRKMKSNSLIAVPSGGINMVHVNDVASGIVDVLCKGRAGERYLLGGQNISLKDLSRLFVELRGKPGLILEIPALLIAWPLRIMCRICAGLFPSRAGSLSVLAAVPAYKYYSSDKAMELGYNATVSAREMVAEALGTTE